MSGDMTHLRYAVKGQQDVLGRHLLQLGGQILRHSEWALLVCVHKQPRKVRNKASVLEVGTDQVHGRQNATKAEAVQAPSLPCSRKVQ